MSTYYRNALGYVLREVRTKRGMTLRQVAAKGHIALGYLSELERGHKDASSEVLESLARGLDTTAGNVSYMTAQVMLSWEQQAKDNVMEQLDELVATNS